MGVAKVHVGRFADRHVGQSEKESVGLKRECSSQAPMTQYLRKKGVTTKKPTAAQTENIPRGIVRREEKYLV